MFQISSFFCLTEAKASTPASLKSRLIDQTAQTQTCCSNMNDSLRQSHVFWLTSQGRLCRQRKPWYCINPKSALISVLFFRVAHLTAKFPQA